MDVTTVAAALSLLGNAASAANQAASAANQAADNANGAAQSVTGYLERVVNNETALRLLETLMQAQMREQQKEIDALKASVAALT